MKKILLMLSLTQIIYSNNYIKEYNNRLLKERYLAQFFSAISTKNNEFAKTFLYADAFKEKLGEYDVPVDTNENKIKININDKDKNGYTAIITAVMNNNLEMLIYLLENGANINVKHPIYKKPLLITAINFDATEVAEYLIDKYKNMINQASTDDGWTPIQEAVLKENQKIVKKLLENGADARKKDNNNYDAFDVATIHGKGIIVKILKDFDTKK